MQRILVGSAARRQLQLRAQRAIGVSEFLASTTQVLPTSRISPLHLNRIRTLQLRCFTSDDEFDHEISRETTRVLNHSATRLGTMSVSLVDDTIASCQYWCNTGTGYGADSADRLLQRLISEHASGSTAALQRTDTIVELQQDVLKSWLTLSSDRFALEKAGAVLESMIQWHERGISAHDPFTAVVAVVEASLPHPDLAANLLLQFTQSPNSDTASELAPLFNQALSMCVEENDPLTASLLLQRMETLKAEQDWQNIEISDVARKLALEGPSSPIPIEEDDDLSGEDDSIDDTGIKQLSEFELQAVQGRFIEFIKSATAEDKQQVLKMAKQLPTLPQTDATVSLYKSFMDYFIRIEDAKLATQLLSRMDTDKDLQQSEALTEDLFVDILRLWVKSQHVDAPWRAQEVVMRMEELESLDLLKVSTVAYNLLCETWVKSADPAASQKVEDVLSRMFVARSKGDTSKAPDLDTFKHYLSAWPKGEDNLVAQVVSELTAIGAELSTEEFSGIVGHSLEALSTEARQLQDRGDVASKLFRQAVSQDIHVTPAMCVNLVKSQQKSGESILRELLYLESLSDVDIPLECYELAIMALFDSWQPSFNQKKSMVGRVLKRYADGKLSADPSEMEALMVRIMKELAFQGRPSSMDTMLRFFEEWVLSDEALIKNLTIPQECFNIVLNGWTNEGETAKVEETFHRLLSYYEAGHSSLLPSADSFSKLLNVAVHRSKKGLTDKVIAEKATNIFQRMLMLHESTGSAVCKPNKECFDHVLMALSKVGTLEAANQSLTLLKQMISMRITPTVSAFNKVMYAVSRTHFFDGPRPKFFTVLSLMKQMKTMGVEPDQLTYKNMLRACYYRMKRRDSRDFVVKVAMDVMGRLRRSNQADAGSYGMLAASLRRQLSEESSEKRDKLLSTTCRLCYEDGFLTKENARLFRDAMSEGAWTQLESKLSSIEAKKEATEQTGT